MWSIIIVGIVLLAIASFIVFAIMALDKTFTKFLLRQNEKNLHTIHKVSKTIHLLLFVCFIALLAITLLLSIFTVAFSQNFDLIYSLLYICMILLVQFLLFAYSTALKTSEKNSSIQEKIANENEVDKILSYKEQKKVNLVLTDASTNIVTIKTFTLTEENYTNLIRSFQYTLE